MNDTALNDSSEEPMVITIGGEDKKAPFEYDDKSSNLVFDFVNHPEGEQVLDDLVDLVLDDFDKDWEGNRKWRERVKKDMKLFAGDLPAKDFPFENAANAHVPILIENILRLSTRSEAEIFGDWKSVAKVIPVGMEDEDMAEIMSLHTNWQIRNQIPDFKRQMKRAILAFWVAGDVTVQSWWNPKTKRNCHDYLSVDDFVVPWSHVSTDPSYGDLQHYTKICRYYRNQLQAMRGTWYGVEEVLEKKATDEDTEPTAPFREGIGKVQGEEKPGSKADDLSNGAPYVILQYEGWLELPEQQSDRWCQVIVDKGTRRVLSLKILEKPKWEDQLRFDKQQAEMDGYRQSMAQYASQAQEHSRLQTDYQAAVQGGMPVDPMALQQMQAQTPQMPPAPEWVKDPHDLNTDPEPVEMEQILMFSHAVAIEPLTGTLGLGTGRILGDYNRAANVLLSQFIDSATLANISGMITAENVEFDRTFNWSPGAINKARGVTGAELKDAVMPMQHQPANPQMLQLIQSIQQNAQGAAQSPDVLSGKSGKSGETYRGQAGRLEQAVKQITVMGATLGDLVTLILRKNAELNAVYLSDEEFFQVTKAEAKYAPQLRVTRQLYQRNYEIELESDMRFIGEEQKQQEADQLLQMANAFPQLQQNISFFQQALARVLTTRKRKDLIPFACGPLLPAPQTPLGINPMGPPPGAPPGPGAPSGGPPGKPPPGPPGSAGPPQAPGPEHPQAQGAPQAPQGPPSPNGGQP